MPIFGPQSFYFMLANRKILIGICGGIAAYKILLLIRLLRKAGAEVKVILTPEASDFVGKVSLAALSGHPVWDRFTDEENGEWNNHVDLGLWAEIFLIAPLTANTLAKLAHGQSDNLLIATYLSARCPVIVAPAMDLDMWVHPSTQRNLACIKKDGVSIIEPIDGPLASGLSGKGRMEEPEIIFNRIQSYFLCSHQWQGKRVLITLGPTRESIDPVRFISNHSSGKMGAALCEQLSRQGAKVIAICGPVSQNLSIKANEFIKVESADQMFEACIRWFPEVDGAIMAAAVADYTPVMVADKKIKKAGDSLVIELKKTKDIASQLGKMKKDNQFLIGFALETDNELDNARQKMEKKNLDAIVLNSMNDPGAGFGHSTNKITILGKQGTLLAFETKSKSEVAKDIIDYVAQKIMG